MDKARVIERSLRCFVLGGLGLIPVVGLASAALAIILFRKVRAEARAEWNPARKYLYWGTAFACVGLAGSGLLLGSAMFLGLLHLIFA